jgi:hypothetical protein
MAGRITRHLVSKLVFLMLLQAGLLLAQTAPDENTDQQDENAVDQNKANAEEEAQSQLPRRGRSLQDSVTQDPRNGAGFSLGLYGLYDSAPVDKDGTPQKRGPEGMILPMVFANLGKKTATLHADYSMERRIFRNTDADTTFYTGNLGFTLMPSRDLIIDLFDEVRSAPSNLLSLSGGFVPGLPGGSPLGPGTSAYSFDRLTMNNLTGRIGYQFTDNNAFSIYGNSQIFRYDKATSENMNPYDIGANLAHSFSRDVDAAVDFLAGNYDTLSGSRKERIKRLSGTLNYRMTRHWSVRGSGGVEWVSIQGSKYTPTYVEGGLGRVSRRSVLSFSYRRGAQYQLGTSILTATHTASASLDQRMSKKSSLYISGNYYRSKNFAQGPQQTTFITGLGLKYLLIPNIIVSANGNYLYQNKALLSGSSGVLNRYVIFAGLEFIVPGVHNKKERRSAPDRTLTRSH